MTIKNRFFRLAINWLALNVLVGLPLFWVLTNGMPDRLDWTVCTAKPVSVNVYSLESDGKRTPEASTYFFGKDTPQLYKMWLHGSRDLSQLRWEVAGDTADFKIESISALQRLFIRKRYDQDNGTWQLDFKNRLFAVGLIGCESLLVLLALGLTWYRHDACRLRFSVLHSACLALLGSTFFVWILPVQSFLVNRFDFPFELRELLLTACMAFLIVWPLLTGVLFLCERLWGRTIHALFMAFLIYEYLETGILSIGHPPINGEMDFFRNVSAGIKDSMILMCVLGAFALCARWIKNYLHWIALAFLVLSAVSLFDVKTMKRPNVAKQLIHDFNSKGDVANSAFYSANRNVLVFVLDMATAEVVKDVIDNDAELRAKFPGFVDYQNNLGMHMSTDVGTAGMMTGLHFDDPSKLVDYTFSIFGERSLLKNYLDGDIPMFVMPGSMHFGYSNRMIQKRASRQSVQEHESPYKRRMSGQLEWNLAEVVRFRAAPFISKAFLFKLIAMNWSNTGEITVESELYPMIAKRPVRNDIPCTFHWYHTQGCHPPLDVDRNGRKYDEPQTGYSGYFERIYYVLRQLGNLFETYRSAGIYDKSTIVVCADHGAGYRNGKCFIKGDISEKAFPFLWVKPANAKGLFETSLLPTSHAKLAPLCRALQERALSREEMEMILKTEDRVYRETLGSNLVDWHVDATGKVRKEVVPIARDLNKLKPLQRGKSYSLESHNHDKPDIVTDALDMASAYAPRLHTGVNNSYIRFRVDGQGSCSVVLRLETMIVQTGHLKPSSADPYIEVSGKGAKPVTVRFDNTEKVTAVVNGVESDANGVVEIRLTRKGMNDSIFIPRIEVK